MYTGWMAPFPINRKLEAWEKEGGLPRIRQNGIGPNQRLGLVRISSDFIEWIDRRFLYRGMLNVSLVFLCVISFFILGGWLAVRGSVSDGDERMFFMFSVLAPVAMIALLYYKVLSKEFFTCVYYPIRFNRKTRNIHIFRDKRDGGILTVPWDSVFFHIGRGTDMKFLRDIRGEVMEGDIVKDTFALGHCAESDRPVLEMWEFIRRYMEEGPEAVAEVPLDKYVELSVAPTL
uniref:DUF6708 domain-containing protein n=1 Tax=Burkholderia pseudomallei TaxID=28450 RepID=UPI0018AA6929